MSDIIPTVKIKNGDDYTVINEADYNSAEHELFVEPVAAEADEPEDDPFVIDAIEDARRSVIVIPEKYEALSAAEARALADDIVFVEGKMAKSKTEAVAFIKAELDRRAAKAV